MVGGNWLKSIFFLFLDHLPGFPNYTFLNFQKKFFSLHPNIYVRLKYAYSVQLLFSSVNLFGEHKHKVMIPNAHIILIATGFMRSPSND